MHGEIIAIGDEIISGKVLNTNSNFSARSLFHAGYEIKRITSIGDDLEDIKEVLTASIKRSKFVIVTGGLGPTPDDITNEAVARAFGLKLIENKSIRNMLETSCTSTYPLTEYQKRKLTHLPEGAEILNPNSRASGYMLRFNDTLLFFLPGMPNELEEHLRDQVLPRLRALIPSSFVFLQKTFKVFGLKEPEVNARLDRLKLDKKRVLVGYYPNFPEVFVTITLKGSHDQEAKECFDDVIFAVREILKDYVIAEDEETLEQRIGTLLLKRGKVLALAESCTGGLIASRITTVPGSSNWFDRGVVTYSNQAKMELLGVKRETLRRFGAVSPETCREMVEGLKQKNSAHYFISVTGIAGPSGGSPQKPVGTVYIGLGSREDVNIKRFQFKGTRTVIQELTAETALDLLRRELEKSVES